VVEDTPDNMRLFRAVLTRQGHELAELVDGTGLVETIRDFQPELILLDIQLPIRDGFELLAEIRGLGEPHRTVVALTAHGFESDRETLASAGFDGCITKPIDINQFPRQLLEFLQPVG
jgi:two-component system cell cycle response regulator DivK